MQWTALSSLNFSKLQIGLYNEIAVILGESTDDELREEVAAVKSETMLKSGNFSSSFCFAFFSKKDMPERVSTCVG